MSQNTGYLIAPADSGYTTPAIGTTAMCENVIKTANVQIQICYETVAGASLKKKKTSSHLRHRISVLY